MLAKNIGSVLFFLFAGFVGVVVLMYYLISCALHPKKDDDEEATEYALMEER